MENLHVKAADSELEEMLWVSN